MFRSEAMRQVARLMRVAAVCERRGISAGDALGLRAKLRSGTGLGGNFCVRARALPRR
jgi:hypothetical protein